MHDEWMIEQMNPLIWPGIYSCNILAHDISLKVSVIRTLELPQHWAKVKNNELWDLARWKYWFALVTSQSLHVDVSIYVSP